MSVGLSEHENDQITTNTSGDELSAAVTPVADDTPATTQPGAEAAPEKPWYSDEDRELAESNGLDPDADIQSQEELHRVTALLNRRREAAAERVWERQQQEAEEYRREQEESRRPAPRQAEPRRPAADNRQHQRESNAWEAETKELESQFAKLKAEGYDGPLLDTLRSLVAKRDDIARQREEAWQAEKSDLEASVNEMRTAWDRLQSRQQEQFALDNSRKFDETLDSVVAQHPFLAKVLGDGGPYSKGSKLPQHLYSARKAVYDTFGKLQLGEQALGGDLRLSKAALLQVIRGLYPDEFDANVRSGIRKSVTARSKQRSGGAGSRDNPHRTSTGDDRSDPELQALLRQYEQENREAGVG